jgi:DNA-binding LytR/AlgR family response regulator
MLEEELGQYGFVRCHKGLLINLRYVDTLQGTNVLVAGKWLPVSRNRRKAVLEALLNYAKGGRADS